MDTAFYLAGPEVFLWETANRLRQAGVENRRIKQELAGSAARRVYCVHCRTISEAVTTTIHRCTCGMSLTVRDHFSRPLSAYMGVVVDAESPGDVPEAGDAVRMNKPAPRQVRVTDIVSLTPRIKRFTLKCVEGRRLPAWSGGSHIPVDADSMGNRPGITHTR